MPHDPSDNNCPRNADPRNETCGCGPRFTKSQLQCQDEARRYNEIITAAKQHFDGAITYLEFVWKMTSLITRDDIIEHMSFHTDSPSAQSEIDHMRMLYNIAEDIRIEDCIGTLTPHPLQRRKGQ